MPIRAWLAENLRDSGCPNKPGGVALLALLSSEMQSINRRAAGGGDCFAFLHFVSSWDFSSLDRRCHKHTSSWKRSFILSAGTLPSRLLFKDSVYLKGLARHKQARPTSGPTNLSPRHRRQTWTLEIWFLLVTDEHREPLVSLCGQILLMSGQLACGQFYWLFTITHFMWLLSEWKYNESLPCFMSQETWLKLSVLKKKKKRSLLVKSH